MTIFETALETKKITSWLEGFKLNPFAYYEVEFSHNDSGRFNALMLSNTYLQQHQLDVSLPVFGLAEEALILEMLIEGAIILDESAPACNWRLKLLRWYHSLTQEEKLVLPIFGNKLSLRRGLKMVPSLTNIQHGLTQHEGVRLAYDAIHEDLTRLGVISREYKTVKERFDLKEPSVFQENALVDFRRLRVLPLNSKKDLEGSTPESPFRNLKHAFAFGSMKAISDSGISNYLEAFKWAGKFFLIRGFQGTEPLDVLLEPYFLSRFRAHLEQKIVTGDLSPSSANGILSAARKTLATLTSLSGFHDYRFINAPGFDIERVTDMYKPYSSAERLSIATSVDEDIARYKLLSQPYQMTGIGVDPSGHNGMLKYGFGKLENAQWIFENKLNCSSVGFDDYKKDDAYTKIFLRIIAKSKSGLRDVIESWGVHYRIDSWVIAPYAIKLAQVTGLNADSLKFLDVDDYVDKHPATGRPCLRYWKERSVGGKMYPLDLFEAEISWLTSAQSREVAEIFSAMIELTSSFRDSAPQSYRDKLFIWQSSAPRTFEVVKSFASSHEGSLLKVFNSYVQRKSLMDDSGAPLSLTPSRLRPSFISELVERDVTLREIQLILGHQNIGTTIAYLDRLDFNNIARSKLDVALRDLHGRTLLEESPALDNIRDVTISVDQGENNLIDVQNITAPRVVFKTPLAGCTNIFNPPEFVKKLSSYVPGRPCSLYNMCLGCSNSLITASNLPELFAMQREYTKLTEVSRIMDTPYGHVVRENLALLKNILTEDISDFSSEELSQGRRLAEFLDTTVLIDGVGV